MLSCVLIGKIRPRVSRGNLTPAELYSW